jgi:hypothetical protein
MVNNVYERSFSYKMHMIQKACNLRYKDAYTSCYIWNTKCRKCIKENYTYATMELPHTQLKKSSKHQAPPAKEWKLLDLGVWWIYRLIGHVWVHGSKLSSLFQHYLSENDISLLCAWFWNEALVLCNTYGTRAVTLKWNMGILLTKVTHGVCDPKELRATTSYGNVLCLGSGLSNTRLFAGRPRHQRRPQKLARPRSGLPIQPTPDKIRVWKTMKSQRRRHGVPKAEVGSVTQVPEYALDRFPMQSPWRRLKTSARTYRELDVWPCRRQVEEWPDHASILLLVHVFTFLIRIKSCSRTHRRRHGLGIHHLEFPHNVLGILSLVHKCSFLWLLDL